MSDEPYAYCKKCGYHADKRKFKTEELICPKCGSDDTATTERKPG